MVRSEAANYSTLSVWNDQTGEWMELGEYDNPLDAEAFVKSQDDTARFKIQTINEYVIQH